MNMLDVQLLLQPLMTDTGIMGNKLVHCPGCLGITKTFYTVLVIKGDSSN